MTPLDRVQIYLRYNNLTFPKEFLFLRGGGNSIVMQIFYSYVHLSTALDQICFGGGLFQRELPSALPLL